MPDLQPRVCYPAPEALIRHCARPKSGTSLPNTGTRDRDDVAALLRWLTERDEFATHDAWVSAGMALKLEFGDDGLDLWQITHDSTVTAEVEQSKWDSFATEPTSNSVTLNSLLARAHALGWRGSVRKSTSALFDGVAALAAASGASLAPAGGMPMLAGQEELTRVGTPILNDFLASTNDLPNRPANADSPTLPDAAAGHGLFQPLKDAIGRVLAAAETPKAFKGARFVDVLALLSLVHQDTFDCVCRRIRTLGCSLPDSKIKLSAAAISDRVKRAFVPQDDWIYDVKGQIEHTNSDNVAVLLNFLGMEIRFNAWLERAEIRGWDWKDWTYLDDTVIAKLRTRANRTGTRFLPGKEFFWESMLALAHANPVDPALEALSALQSDWDGTPRLSLWLSKTCGVACDPYHQAVGRNIIGGMVRRIRNPGCKHDTMPIFFGAQGTGKSTMIAMLAPRPEWFTDSVLLGDASKELVLSLAGKCIVEVSEMGMHGTANPNHVKAMLSRQTDAGRTAYARAVSERPRRNIFCGSTNESQPLQDTTGNRRFLPVRVAQEIDLAWLAANVQQLIGEAAVLEAKGETFALPREVWAAAAEHQEAARATSDIETSMVEWFWPTEHTRALSYVTAFDLVTLASLAGWRSNGAHNSRTGIMKRLGFREDNITIDGKRTRMWVRGTYSRPSEVATRGVRYTIGADAQGRPVVRIRMNAPSA